MSTLRNQVQLIGRLGADVEIKMTSQGKPYAHARLATNELYKTTAGEWKEDVQWHKLSVWGEKLTRLLEQNGHKGSQLLVQGTLQYSEYEDSQGIKRTSAEIRVSQIMPFQNQVKPLQMASEPEEEYEAAPSTDLP